MEADKWFAEEGDLAAARELAAASENAELFLYPGDQHLFADSSLPSYNKPATDLLIQRVLAFLRTIA
jgi:dienelactone hydrolase